MVCKMQQQISTQRSPSAAPWIEGREKWPPHVLPETNFQVGQLSGFCLARFVDLARAGAVPCRGGAPGPERMVSKDTQVAISLGVIFSVFLVVALAIIFYMLRIHRRRTHLISTMDP